MNEENSYDAMHGLAASKEGGAVWELEWEKVQLAIFDVPHHFHLHWENRKEILER